MIVEMRLYTLKVGQVPAYLRLYETEGIHIQRPILGRMIGYYSSDIGPQHQIAHLWAYTDHAEREERRARLAADPRWKVYLRKVAPLQIAQENRILKPAPFSPLPADDWVGEQI